MIYILSQSSIGFLFSGSSALTAELLGLASSGVSHKHGSVVSDQDLLDFPLGLLVDELLVESHDSLANSLSDGVDLRSVSSSSDSDSDVELGEPLSA